VLLFGNPKLDTPQMQTNRHVAIADAASGLGRRCRQGLDRLHATLYAEKALQARWLGEILKTLAGALDAFTNAAANRPRARATMRTAVSAGC
jgi:hypothetical protein